MSTAKSSLWTAAGWAGEKNPAMKVIKKTSLTPEDGVHRIHTYFTGSPSHPDGQRLLYTRLKNLRDPADICILDRRDGKETTLGLARNVWFHSGGRAWFVSHGQKVMYHSHQDWIAQEAESPGNEIHTVDLASGSEVVFNGSIVNYSRNIGDWYIEIDANYNIDRQGDMGVYLRRNDGTDKRRLASVENLLAAHPQGKSLRESGVLFRLGGAISPDESRVLLFLVARFGTFIRDYFVCDLNGDNLAFHGRLGGHVSWHPDSRHILGYATPEGCSWFSHLRGDNQKYGGYLGCYDIVTRELQLLSDLSIAGNCHVSASPDGLRVVIDSHDEDRLDIWIFDYATGSLEKVFSEPHILYVKSAGTDRLSLPNGRKHYNTHAHAVFSPDSRRVIFNSCPKGTVGLAELELE